ncbi:MAG TPA: branched-chain amino acid ABC transporter permease [Acidimicrobiales bacterium]
MDQVPVYFLLSLPLVGAFAMFAVGIVVTYQASRVLNLAHGAMAMAPPFVVYEASRLGVPLLPAVALGVASGAAIGVAVERCFVAVLRKQSSTAQTVGTVAVLGLLVAVASKIWGTTPRNGVALFPDGGLEVGNSLLRYGQIGLMAVAVACSGLLFALFRSTDLGLAMRAAAQNRRAASLMGVDPDLTARLAWALSGALAAMGGILLAAIVGLHPYNLALMVLPAFVAALIGGLDRLDGALVGALVVGLAQGMVPATKVIPGLGSLATQVGAPQLVLALLAFVVMYVRGERLTGGDVRGAP